jgi:hypothetical protein
MNTPPPPLSTHFPKLHYPHPRTLALLTQSMYQSVLLIVSECDCCLYFGLLANHWLCLGDG